MKKTISLLVVIGLLLAFLFVMKVFLAPSKGASATETGEPKGDVSACCRNLRLWQEALVMYRSDHDGDGKFGYCQDMGLPESMADLVGTGYLDPEGGRAMRRMTDECTGTNFSCFGVKSFPFWQTWTFRWKRGSPDGNNFADYARETREKMVIDQDFYHNSPNVNFHSPYDMICGLGITLDGTLVWKRGKNYRGPHFWMNCMPLVNQFRDAKGTKEKL